MTEPVKPVVVAFASALLCACGGNTAEVPPELLEAIRESQGATGAADYPSGPYGTEVGDVLADKCFEGWRDPAAAGFDSSAFETICFSDFYDPNGDEIVILLVNAAAVWCTSCKLEYGGTGQRPSLSEHLSLRRDQGFRILGTLFQDAASEPAEGSDAELWVRQFPVDFPFVIDPAFQLGDFTQAASAPFNMLIDTATMEIIFAAEGDQPAVIFTTVDSFLQDRGLPSQ